jgi:iron complex outermembrane receptor protein
LIADMVDHQDGYGIYRFLNGSYQTDRHEVSCDYPDNKMDQSGDGETLRIKYSGNGFSFLSVTSNRSYERLLLYDRDGTSYPSQYANFTWEDTQRSQEFRIYSNNENSSFKWLFGVYGFMEEVGTVNDVESLYYGTLWDNRTDMDISGFAAFTHLTYTFWNRLHLTAGLRFDHHDLEGELTGAPSYLTAAGQKLSAELNYDELLPKFALSFDCTDNIMYYATVAKGCLIGGFNYVSAYSQQAFTYDSEYTWNYELGVKTSWLDDKLWVNAALFYIDMKDKQVFETDQTVPIAGAQNIKNAAEAHSVGGEIELHARPLRGLDLFAGFSMTESKIDDWLAVESDESSYDYEGKYLTYYPKETFNVGVQYHHASGLFGRVDLFYYGQSYCDPENLIEQDAYQEVNLRLGYMGENFDIIIWGKNLFDEEYFNYMTYYGSNVLVVDGPPRTFGATLVYHF